MDGATYSVPYQEILSNWMDSLLSLWLLQLNSKVLKGVWLPIFSATM